MGLGIDLWPRIVRNHGYAPTFLAKCRKARRVKMRAIEGETDSLPVFELDEFRRFRERNVPAWAVDIVRAVCAAHGVPVAAVSGRVRNETTDRARRAAVYAIKAAQPDISSTTLGKWFGRHHTSILFALAVHQSETGAAPLTRYAGKGVQKARAA
jgi:hypothetical protein